MVNGTQEKFATPFGGQPVSTAKPFFSVGELEKAAKGEIPQPELTPEQAKARLAELGTAPLGPQAVGITTEVGEREEPIVEEEVTEVTEEPDLEFTQEDLPRFREILRVTGNADRAKRLMTEIKRRELGLPEVVEEEVKEDVIEEIPKERKTTIKEVIQDIPAAFDVVTGGVIETGKSIKESADTTSTALFRTVDKLVLKSANFIREAIGKEPITEEEAKETGIAVAGGLETKVTEDILDIGQGSFQLGLTSAFPVATLGFTTAAQTEEGEKVLQSIGKTIQTGGEFINKTPGLSNFRDSLPEERRPDFDAFVGQAVTLGLFKSGSKLSDILAKWKAAETLSKQTEITGKILRPTKGEIKKGLLESGEKGLKKIAKETGKDVKDFAGLEKSIKPIKEKTFKPLKEGLDKAQSQLNKIEKTKPFKGNTQDRSTTTALNQLADITEGLGSKEGIALRNEVIGLIKRNQTKGLNLNELQRVKQLHTQQNKLFTEKGEIRGKTISREDLRNIRKDIKEVIEQRAEVGGFKDVKSINKEFGEILSAEQLIKERVAEVKTAGFKVEKPGLIEKGVGFLLELPVVKQTFTAGGQAIFNKFAKGVTERNISITQLEAQLPKLLKQLRDAGEPAGNVSGLIKTLRDAGITGIKTGVPLKTLEE